MDVNSNPINVNNNNNYNNYNNNNNNNSNYNNNRDTINSNYDKNDYHSNNKSLSWVGRILKKLKPRQAALSNQTQSPQYQQQHQHQSDSHIPVEPHQSIQSGRKSIQSHNNNNNNNTSKITNSYQERRTKNKKPKVGSEENLVLTSMSPPIIPLPREIPPHVENTTQQTHQQLYHSHNHILGSNNTKGSLNHHNHPYSECLFESDKNLDLEIVLDSSSNQKSYLDEKGEHVEMEDIEPNLTSPLSITLTQTVAYHHPCDSHIAGISVGSGCGEANGLTVSDGMIIGDRGGSTSRCPSSRYVESIVEDDSTENGSMIAVYPNSRPPSIMTGGGKRSLWSDVIVSEDSHSVFTSTSINEGPDERDVDTESKGIQSPTLEYEIMPFREDISSQIDTTQYLATSPISSPPASNTAIKPQSISSSVSTSSKPRHRHYPYRTATSTVVGSAIPVLTPQSSAARTNTSGTTRPPSLHSFSSGRTGRGGGGGSTTSANVGVVGVTANVTTTLGGGGGIANTNLASSPPPMGIILPSTVSAASASVRSLTTPRVNFSELVLEGEFDGTGSVTGSGGTVGRMRQSSGGGTEGRTSEGRGAYATSMSSVRGIPPPTILERVEREREREVERERERGACGHSLLSGGGGGGYGGDMESLRTALSFGEKSGETYSLWSVNSEN